jgi:hypothetical protein
MAGQILLHSEVPHSVEPRPGLEFDFSRSVTVSNNDVSSADGMNFDLCKLSAIPCQTHLETVARPQAGQPGFRRQQLRWTTNNNQHRGTTGSAKRGWS